MLHALPEHKVGGRFPQIGNPTTGEYLPVLSSLFTVHPGTTAGQHWLWRGVRDGETLIEFETLWTVGGEYPNHWPKPKDGWTLNIEGDPSMQNHFFSLASFTKPKSLEEHVCSANVATAMPILHALPAVCAAPPGFGNTDRHA